jgi:hypothetical protein
VVVAVDLEQEEAEPEAIEHQVLDQVLYEVHQLF